MQNVLAKERRNCIFNTIKENTGENKVLHEWFTLINQNLPKQKRMTIRSLSHIMNTMGRNGYFILHKQTKARTIFYKFEIKGVMSNDKRA